MEVKEGDQGFNGRRVSRRNNHQYPWEQKQNQTGIPRSSWYKTKKFPWIKSKHAHVPGVAKWHIDKAEPLPWNPNQRNVFLDPYIGHRRGRLLPWSRKSLNLNKIHNESWSTWIWDLFELPSALIRNLVTPWECNDTFVKGGPTRKFYQLWPTGFNESKDRILNQLAVTINDLGYSTVNVSKLSSNVKLKKILVYGSGVKSGQQEFIESQLM